MSDQRNESEAVYGRRRGRWAWLHDSYVGGERYDDPSSATLGTQTLTVYVHDKTAPKESQYSLRQNGTRRSYLVPHPGETPAEFDLRARLAAYTNICQPIVDAYVDAITPYVKRELGALEPQLSNLDGQDKTWPELVDEVARWTGVFGFTATVLDAPRASGAQSGAQERMLGVSLRAVVVQPPAFAWVKIGDDSALDEFAYVESTYTDATVDACGVVVWVWTRTEWFVLKGTVSTTAPIAAQTEKLKQVSDLRGTHGTPGTVPVAFCYHKRDTSVRFPLGTSIIDDTAKAAQLIYNEMSRIEEYHRKTSPFLAIPTEEKSGVLDPEVAIGVGPDTAMGYSSTAGAPTWVTPPSDMPAEIRTHCLFIAQSAFKSAGLEVEVDTSAQVQSGEALRVRSRGFESRARRFAANLRAWEIRMLKLASQWTKAQVEPVVTYPERYVLPDLSEDLARAIAFMDKFGDKLGPEGTATLINQALRAAATLSDDEAVSIIDEVHRKLTAPGATGTSEIFGYDLDAGLPTANEMRARKNLPPAEGGNVSVIVWKAVQEALAAKTIRDMGLAPASPPVGGAA